jgi:hypothetical protein
MRDDLREGEALKDVTECEPVSDVQEDEGTGEDDPGHPILHK